jgi:GNAT superfamily N-acetyltransferase
MIEYRKLQHSDYEDILEISKDLWNGCDYLPQYFHNWVDSKGLFLGAVDTDKNSVVGLGKYSVLPDGSGWLEGLRVHKDYRGLKIARTISDRLLSHAKDELNMGNIKRIGFGTHLTNVESRSMMEKNNFNLLQKSIIISKDYETLDETLKIESFNYQPWNVSYEEFSNHPYFKRRDNILALSFVFQHPTREVYEYLKKDNSFFKINGHCGIYQFKGEAAFISMEDSFEAISTITDYFLVKLKDTGVPAAYTAVLEEDRELIQRLKDNRFIAWSDWEPDYLYYVYK